MSEALLAGVVSFALLAVVFVPLERAYPARRGQKVLRHAWWLDGLFFIGQYLLWNAAAVGLLTVVAGAIASAVPEAVREAVAAAPLGCTVLCAIVLGDLCVYGFHRACHRFELLWRFHAIHHSSERLDWLAAHREHPVDGLLTQLFQNLPAIALGVPVEVLAPIAVFRGMWAVFVHSNVRVPLGPLRWLFGAPDLHHWHHARVARTRHNFANLAPWIDVLFRTHHRPAGEEVYPLGVAERTPRGYLGHLVWPLRARREADPDAITRAVSSR